MKLEIYTYSLELMWMKEEIEAWLDREICRDKGKINVIRKLKYCFGQPEDFASCKRDAYQKGAVSNPWCLEKWTCVRETFEVQSYQHL